MSTEEKRPAENTGVYVEVDKNMIVETNIAEPDIKFYDVRRAPFELYGFYDPQNSDVFRRIPEEVAAATSNGVKRLARESAGGRVRFSTDSLYVAIKVRESAIARNPHITLAMSGGFDLYEDTEADSRYHRVFMPPYDMTDGYEQIIRFGSRKMRHFTINFPIHAVVHDLYVGLQADAKLSEGLKYDGDKPIIIYGSSIVHGTAASRPGLVYPNILCRRLNRNCINLGFSGNAKAEPAICEYMAGLDMEMFVCDYDHNAPTVEYLRETHLPLYLKIREKHPNIPYIMISRPNPSTNLGSAYAERRDVVFDTYRYALEHGDKNVYYIDGESFFLGKYENECSMDGTHPNDLGFVLMADGIESEIRRAFRKKAEPPVI